MYLVFDGGNGGHLENKGYGSFKLFTEKGGELLEHIERHEFTQQPMTNNEAEYNTLLLALKYIALFYTAPTNLVIEGDSELVRQQVLGNWQIKKKELQPLRDDIVKLLTGVTYEYNHVPREYIVSILGH
jgi:ribonuclease HI